MLYEFVATSTVPDFPGGSNGKASAYNAGDLGSIPRLGRSPGEGNGNPLQYSCLENPMDGGTWQATVHGVPKSRTGLLSVFTFTFHHSLCDLVQIIELVEALVSLFSFAHSVIINGDSVCLRDYNTTWVYHE